MSPVITLVGLTGFFRLAEIVYGEINARKMLAKGGKEFNPGQRVPVFILYAAWLAALLVVVPWDAPPNMVFIALFCAATVLRWWAIYYLKEFWTTRIIVRPFSFKVTGGPYAFLRHPIYIALISEIMALSLAFDQVVLAIVAGVGMILWLYFRIKAENRALQMML